MGAHVMDGAAPLEPQFPPRPPPPAYANLDVTAMCALVSEVANGGAESGGTPEVLAWAARISHWVDCVAAEAEDPLLPRLMPVLEVPPPPPPGEGDRMKEGRGHDSRAMAWLFHVVDFSGRRRMERGRCSNAPRAS